MTIAIALYGACAAVACEPDDVKPSRDEGSQDGKNAGGKDGGRSFDCAAYCSKQRECSPGAAQRNTNFHASCLFDCNRATQQRDDVALFYASVAGCKDEACGERFGACVVDEMTRRVPADKPIALDVRGLAAACANARACIDAGSHVHVHNRLKTRAALYSGYAGFFDGLRRKSVDGDLVCRMMVENEMCAGRPSPQPGQAIPVDCDAYCDKQKSCFPTYAKVEKWDEHCRDDCKREAAEGTTAAGFFAAVVACKPTGCGALFGECLTREVGTHWPKSQPAQWDVRGLPPKCLLLRACQDALYGGNEGARGARQGAYESYRKVFTTLASEGGEAGKHCETMASYSTCD